MGWNIEPTIKRRIIDGEFVDFSRLLPRDRVLAQQDNRLEIILGSNGQPNFRSVVDSETIGSFHKWEQAFRVFSSIYTDAHPTRGKQLIQYNHTIYSASLTYQWSNVYAYDIDFRLHMAENQGRNWGIILQQAWMLHMKEKIQFKNLQNGSSFNNNNNGNKKTNGKICWKYNRGKCTYGFNCKFDHKCGMCNRFGHGAHNCRKGQGTANNADREGHGLGKDREIRQIQRNMLMKKENYLFVCSRILFNAHKGHYIYSLFYT